MSTFDDRLEDFVFIVHNPERFNDAYNKEGVELVKTLYRYVERCRKEERK